MNMWTMLLKQNSLVIRDYVDSVTAIFCVDNCQLDNFFKPVLLKSF